MSSLLTYAEKAAIYKAYKIYGLKACKEAVALARESGWVRKYSSHKIAQVRYREALRLHFERFTPEQLEDKYGGDSFVAVRLKIKSPVPFEGQQRAVVIEDIIDLLNEHQPFAKYEIYLKELGNEK